MKNKRRIEINAAIFPRIIRLAFGKPLPKDSGVKTVHDLTPEMKVPNIMIDLPKDVNLMA